MRFAIAAVTFFLLSGCYSASMQMRSEALNYQAGGINAPTPVEAATADLTSANADYLRAQARTMERHPQMFFGWWGGYGGVDPNYYYPRSAQAGGPDEQARGLDKRVERLERRDGVLEKGLRDHVGGAR